MYWYLIENADAKGRAEIDQALNAPPLEMVRRTRTGPRRAPAWWGGADANVAEWARTTSGPG